MRNNFPKKNRGLSYFASCDRENKKLKENNWLFTVLRTVFVFTILRARLNVISFVSIITARYTPVFAQIVLLTVEIKMFLLLSSTSKHV